MNRLIEYLRRRAFRKAQVRHVSREEIMEFLSRLAPPVATRNPNLAGTEADDSQTTHQYQRDASGSLGSGHRAHSAPVQPTRKRHTHMPQRSDGWLLP